MIRYMSENKITSGASRLEFVDIARGIAIISVILGHFGDSTINSIVFTFHLPMFLYISGYFLNEKTSYKDFVKKKFKSLIIPYYVTCAAICLISVVKSIFFGEKVLAQLFSWLFASLYGAGFICTEPFYVPSIGGIWYLWATFWASIMLRYLITKKTPVRVISVAAIFALSLLSKKYLFWFPLSIQAGGCSLLFMYIGWVIRQKIHLLKTVKSGILCVLLLVPVSVWIWCVYNFKGFYISSCTISNGILDIIGSIGGCLTVLIISYQISLHSKIFSAALSFFGKNSLIVLCVHIVELSMLPWNELLAIIFPDPVITSFRYMFAKILLKILIIFLTTFALVKVKERLKASQPTKDLPTLVS